MHSKRRSAPLPFVLLLAALVCWAGAAPAASPSALSEFAEAWAKVDDYVVDIHSRESKGSAVQDRVYVYAYRKPHFVKASVIKGPGKGSVAVWSGGDTVRGHEGGFLSIIKVTVGIHEARAVSLRGNSIEKAVFGAMLAHLRSTKGEMTERPGPAIGGVATDEIDLRIADPAANNNVTREQVFVSRESHLPVRSLRYEGDTLVQQDDFVNLQVNRGLSEAEFN